MRTTRIVGRLQLTSGLAALVGVLLACFGAQASAHTTANQYQPNGGALPAGGAQPAGSGVPGGPPQPFSVTPTYANVPYAGASPTETLDVYLPSGAVPHPTVIFFHPGAFAFGSKTDIPDSVGKALLNHGYAVVGMNYRLVGEAKFPAAVQDAKASVRFLRANAATYGLDPVNFVAWGASAGGNLAAMLGVGSDVGAFDDPSLGNPGFSSRVRAVIDWFGPNDFGAMDQQAKAQGCAASDQTHNSADSPESTYLGAPLPTVPELVRQSNPITYVDESDPPFLIQKGDQDCTVPIENTKMLADALKAAGVRVEYDLLQGAGHGGPQFETDANTPDLAVNSPAYGRSDDGGEPVANPARRSAVIG